MTSFGINNEGQLVLDYWHEDTDLLDDANVYNGQNSVLWNNFKDAFPDKIKETYQNLRNNKYITYEKLVDRFITNGSDKWSESIYNEDSDFKYITMLRSANDASNLPQVRGSGEEHFRYFVENRLNYCDSKWYAAEYANDYISLRIYTPNTWVGVEPNSAITVTPFSNMYAGVRYKANGTLYQERVESGESVTFAPKGETFESENNETFNDTETAIYGAHQLSSIGDLAPLYCGSVNVASADKLIELKVGDGTEGYSNTNLRELSVGTNKLLRMIDIQNCPNFASVLDLSNCPSIEEVYAKGSSITGVNFPEAGILKKAQLPATITNFTLKDQLYVEEITFEGYDGIKTLWIENCPTIDSLDILSKAANVDRLRLTDLNLKYDTSAEMLELASRTIGGIDENGTNIDTMWIDGTCHISTLTGAEYLEIKAAFPYMTITYDILTSELIFMSEDGSTELTRQTIQNGGNGVDPVAAGTISKPTKTSTAQYTYSFAGWSLTAGGSASSTALNAVEADRKVYVAFTSTIRTYTVKFYNGSTLLQTVTDVPYGSSATYTGDTPLNETTGNTDDFEFYGWSPSPTNITGNTSCYAQYHDLREITDSWATIAANVTNGTATEKYAVGAFKQLDIGEKELPYEFNQGSAVVYDGEIHILGSVISEYRTSHYKWDGTEWVEVGVIPYEFYYGSAVVYNNEIHILGGSRSSSGRTKHYKWDGSNWTSVSTLPYVFEKCVAIVYDNEIHIMGSRDSSNYTSHYKWNGSAWSEVGKLPYSFYTASGFIYNNEIHVLGSYDSNYETAHYKYDGSSWTSVNTLPQKLSNGHALVVGTDIYMIQWDEFYKYDGTSWHTCPYVPANVYDGRSVVLDGNIYVMGSSISENGRVFYSYAPETSTWSKVGITESIPMQVIAHNHDELPDGVMKWENIGTSLPVTQQYGCAVVLNDEIHVLGGNNSSTYTRHMKWDATNSSWVTVSTLPYQFRSGCAVVLNDEIHILGSYQTSNKTEHYKWNGAEWVSASTLPYAFYCASAVVFNDEIHILGSYNNSNRKAHYKWNGTEWVSVSTLSYNFYYGSAIVYGDEIHIFGGSGASTGHYKWNEDDGWAEVSTLPHDFSSGAAGVVNNEIHIFGGSGAPTEHYKYNGIEWVSVSTLPDDFSNSPLAICKDTPYMFIGMTCYKLVGPSWEEVYTNVVAPGSSSPARMVEYNNELHIFSKSAVHLVYDGETVTESAITLPVSLDTCSVVVYNNEIHTFGGSGDATAHYKYDGKAWTLVDNIPVAIADSTAVIYNSEIHLLFSDTTDYKAHYKWNETDGWVEASTLPYVIRYGCGAVVYKDELHIFGGSGGAAKHYKWNGTEWISVSTLPYKLFYYGFKNVYIYNDEIHLYGAHNTEPAGLMAHYKWNDTEWVYLGEFNKSLEVGSCSPIVIFRNKMLFIDSACELFALHNPRATLTFLAKNLMKDNRVWSETSRLVEGIQSTNAGGWAASDIRTYCNGELLESLPSELQDVITLVKKYSDKGYTDYSIGSSNDHLWLLSNSEIGNSQRGIGGQGEVYPVFTTLSSATACRVDGSTSEQWLRSAVQTNIGHAQFISANGGAVNFASTKLSKAFRFGFCI